MKLMEKKNVVLSIFFVCIAFLGLTIVSLFKPGFEEIQADNLKAKGIFRPNGFIKLELTFPIETLKGLSKGSIEITPLIVHDIWPHISFQVGEDWGESIKFTGYTSVHSYEKMPVHEILIHIPNISSLGGKHIELIIKSSMSYPKKINQVHENGIKFKNHHYGSNQTLLITLDQSPISNVSSWIFEVLLKFQVYLRIVTFLAFFLIGISLLNVVWDFIWKIYKGNRQIN